jgi:predicted nucleic acid-binding protein
MHHIRHAREPTQWAELLQWGQRNRDALENWLGGVIVLPYHEDVARTWGRISAAAIQRGRARPANDTWIATCALSYGLPLATLNVKDLRISPNRHYRLVLSGSTDQLLVYHDGDQAS